MAIEDRGRKLTPQQRAERAAELKWNKTEKRMDARNEQIYTGLVGGPNAKPQGPKGKNLRHSEAIEKEATIKTRTSGLGGKGGPLGGGRIGGDFQDQVK
jgi:hypothetical protein